jgi:hypothetical protein
MDTPIDTMTIDMSVRRSDRISSKRPLEDPMVDVLPRAPKRKYTRKTISTPAKKPNKPNKPNKPRRASKPHSQSLTISKLFHIIKKYELSDDEKTLKNAILRAYITNRKHMNIPSAKVLDLHTSYMQVARYLSSLPAFQGKYSTDDLESRFEDIFNYPEVRSILPSAPSDLDSICTLNNILIKLNYMHM